MTYIRRFNPLVKDGLDLVDDMGAFVTVGTTGVTTIRWASTPSGTLYDMTISDAGAVVLTLVSTTPNYVIPFWFTLIPQ